jgi:hypothetical protein
MAKANRDSLDKDRRFILSSYLEEMERVNEMGKVDFAVTRECSCCGETGYVPKHHKYLCVFCWVAAPFFATNEAKPFGERDSEGRGIDKVNINIPIGIEGVEFDQSSSDITVYSAKYFSQEELQAMVS